MKVVTEVREVLASCPGCKTFETVWVRGDILVPIMRFKQKADGHVYHDCGLTDMPCRLFPKYLYGSQFKRRVS